MGTSKSIGDTAEKFDSLKEYLHNAGDALEAFKKGGAETAAQSTSLATGAADAAKGINSMSLGTEAASGGFKTLTKAIAGTGIGLFIIAVAALVEYFKQFEPVMELVDQGMAALNGVFDLVNRTVLDFVSNLKGVGDFFSKIGNILTDPIGSFEKAATAMGNAAKSAYELKKAQQELDKSTQADAAQTAETAAKVADLLAKSHEKGINAEKRKQLMKQIADIEQQDLNRRKTLADQSLDIALKGAGDYSG